ncbi:hypothetical protein GpartN1_g1186.t1 [Galdieria partita]|uniref:Uncharacterized protein n=1 Tax=Galdieria partita TaxID=83374 RepID=A0A9C7PRW5_9RHOD|nr:hypothetical protein GpartN1_g1186.t1 [Galdieria partita]
MSPNEVDKWFELQSLQSFQFCYPRYLQAKAPIDKKAFHKDTWDHMSTLVNSLSKKTIRLLDVGAGIGSMFLHLLEGQVLNKFSSIEYVLIDSNVENWLFAIDWLISEIKQRFPHYSILQKMPVEEILSTDRFHTTQTIEYLSVDPRNSVHVDQGKSEGLSEKNCLELQLSSEVQNIFLRFYCGDIVHFSQLTHFRGYFDVVIAAAFLDLYDCSSMIETLFNLLQNSGIFYFPINYDGEMSFSPKGSEQPMESQVTKAYHAVMDGIESNEQSQHSQSGQCVLRICKDRAIDMKHGDAWWNVGCEDPKSKYFLMCILRFIKDSTKHLVKGPVLDSYFFLREQQLNQNVLRYFAKNMDCCGKVHFNWFTAI